MKFASQQDIVDISGGTFGHSTGHGDSHHGHHGHHGHHEHHGHHGHHGGDHCGSTTTPPIVIEKH